MNTATKNLEDDHVHIISLIEVMEFITGSDDPDVVHLESIVDIIRNFADGLHHAKEENLFFPHLVKRGFSVNQGPIAVMLDEHVQGRQFVKGIADNLLLFKAGNKSVLPEIWRNVSGYTQLLRNHISKENNILFRMADRVVTEADNADLIKQFEETEKGHSPGTSASDYVKKIQHLTSVYGV